MVSDFIGVYPNLLSDEACDTTIDLFELFDKTGLAKTRQELGDYNRLSKDDKSVFLSSAYQKDTFNIESYVVGSYVVNSVWRGYEQYSSEYGILSDLGEHRIYSCKLQRTYVGGGYHIWHCEQSERSNSNRILAYTVYLNDVDDGGETEFLYLHKRIPAKKGTVCIFPASFTHTHRGNPPLSNTKYIATGWIEF